MIIIQHLSYDHLEESDAGKWTWYVLFTAMVGVLLLLNWFGILPTVFGINTAILLALGGGYKIYYNAISALFERRITAELAIAIAIGAALAIGEYFAAAEAVFIMLVGEGLEEYASRRTRSAIEKLTALTPKIARIKTGDASDEEREVAIDEVQADDVVIIRPGERIPIDGETVRGSSSVNEAPITGESLPVYKWPGDSVFVGSINGTGVLEVRTRSVGADTTLQRIIALIEEAEHKKAPAVRLADRYARMFLPLLLVAVVATWYFTGDWVRMVAVLLVACPCALILATPAAVVAAIGRLARDGVLVKGGVSLEAAAALDCLVFDKTGTLTEGRPVITGITSLNGHSENDLLRLAALVSTKPEEVRVAEVMRQITEQCRARALEQYGIEIVDVRMKRLNLPTQNRESVFARMRAERERIARQYRAEGEAEALKIRAEADREKSRILSESYAEAERIRGDGDAQSTKIYAEAYSRDPKFYKLVRTLEAYKKVIDPNTTAILSSDSELLRLLTQGRAK